MEDYKSIKEEWEQKLTEAGLPSDAKVKKSGEIVPMEAVHALLGQEDRDRVLDTRTEAVLKNLDRLDPKMQSDIVQDLKEKRSAGASFEEILSRLEILSDKGYELMELKDDNRWPKPTLSEEEKRMIRERTDALIEKLEESLEKNKPSEKPKDWVN
jgi:hypothetical protein